MKFKAEMGHWSSVVGNSVHLIGEDGRFLGQIAIMCQDDRLREKDVQTALCEKICAALSPAATEPGRSVMADRVSNEDAEFCAHNHVGTVGRDIILALLDDRNALAKQRDELAAEVERLTIAHNTVCGALAAAITRAEKAQAALDKMIADTRADAFREALKAVSDLPSGKTDDVQEAHEQAYRAILALINEPQEGFTHD